MSLQNQNILNTHKILESNFDKKKLNAGILHIGVGNFHRSHQAYLIDRLIEKKSEYNWGIIGLNLIKSGQKNLKSLQTLNVHEPVRFHHLLPHQVLYFEISILLKVALKGLLPLSLQTLQFHSYIE